VNTDTTTGRDTYVDYTQRFFARWLPVYDWFAWSIAPVYGAAVRCAGPVAGLRVLDACTGTGEIAKRLARRGAEVTAIDVTEGMLARARRKCRALPVRFHRLDARRTSFPDRHFEVAVLSFALHDMPRRVRREVLHEIRRVTRRKLVVLDYELPRSRLARMPLTRIVASFETAYFPAFAAEGAEAQLVGAGIGQVQKVRRLWPFFAIWSVELS
jgi:ubiquinone/menaquinone biosynthesis C-methylase UbiE